MSELQNIRFDIGQLPFKLGRNQILYVADRRHPVMEEFFDEYYDKVCGYFKANDLQFVCLPYSLWDSDSKAIANLGEVLQNFIPEIKPDDIQSFLYALASDPTFIFNGIKCQDGLPILVNADGYAYTIPISKPEQLDYLFSYFPALLKPKERRSQTLYSEFGPLTELRTKEDNFKDIEKNATPAIASLFFQALQIFPPQVIEEKLQEWVNKRNDLSTLVVTKDRHLVLPEYGNKEIPLDAREKALYLLFLKHPEGILLKDLGNLYRNQIVDLYDEMPGADIERSDEIIYNLLNSNELNVLISRIKTKISSLLMECGCPQQAPWYYIGDNGVRLKKINLPADKVVWEGREKCSGKE